jgi:hypothetical protein
MSRIYFHTQNHGAAELYGTERAWIGVSIGDLMIRRLEPLSESAKWMLPLLPSNCYLRTMTAQNLRERAIGVYK